MFSYKVKAILRTAGNVEELEFSMILHHEISLADVYEHCKQLLPTDPRLTVSGFQVLEMKAEGA
ncbi:hypothetical protein CGX12_05050 [Zobellella denitrificans]|uniref:hypothetical protein n=1 Tax=Zobellella denitrificans TaxID=347534 RepID=UPI000B8BCDBC|nr:hypothetical protein [Zobellella denitrificans]OXS16190.1 hypothetical protein CGX12_05050 [Zobellella denitrificans]